MGEGDVASILRELFIVVLKLSAPALLAALAVGLVVSLVQAVTQINESTLAFVPKLLALGLALTVAGPFMYATLCDFTRLLFDHVVAVGGG
ncbi:MAG: flagellar biosynthesis protein FliQ [Gluconacetobacter diazotrophicus]|nr:flagellar biosynthesis protein FliQ [Gluconacetobacter diazotrophicus]